MRSPFHLGAILLLPAACAPTAAAPAPHAAAELDVARGEFAAENIDSSSCYDVGEPGPAVAFSVIFERSGHVKTTLFGVERRPAQTPIEMCFARLMSGAQIPPFEGPAYSVSLRGARRSTANALPRGAFDIDGLANALSAVNTSACGVSSGGLSVVVDPDGGVLAAVIDEALVMRNLRAAMCVSQVVRSARTPAFSGAPRSVHASVVGPRIVIDR